MPAPYGASSRSGIPGGWCRRRAKSLPRAIDDVRQALHARVAIATAAPAPALVGLVEVAGDERQVAGVESFVGEQAQHGGGGSGRQRRRLHDGGIEIPQPAVEARPRWPLASAGRSRGGAVRGGQVGGTELGGTGIAAWSCPGHRVGDAAVGRGAERGRRAATEILGDAAAAGSAAWRCDDFVAPSARSGMRRRRLACLWARWLLRRASAQDNGGNCAART